MAHLAYKLSGKKIKGFDKRMKQNAARVGVQRLFRTESGTLTKRRRVAVAGVSGGEEDLVDDQPDPVVIKLYGEETELSNGVEVRCVPESIYLLYSGIRIRRFVDTWIPVYHNCVFRFMICGCGRCLRMSASVAWR